jgi:hypothetical protein
MEFSSFKKDTWTTGIFLQRLEVCGIIGKMRKIQDSIDKMVDAFAKLLQLKLHIFENEKYYKIPGCLDAGQIVNSRLKLQMVDQIKTELKEK